MTKSALPRNQGCVLFLTVKIWRRILKYILLLFLEKRNKKFRYRFMSHPLCIQMLKVQKYLSFLFVRKKKQKLPLELCSPPMRHQNAKVRSEEHTSELQSRGHLGCRPLLEK